MQPREKILAIVVGVLVLALGANWGWGSYRTGLGVREREIAQLEKTLAAKKHAQAKLVALEKRSLPRDKQFGKSLYQKWLLDLVARAQFADAKLSVVVAPGPDKLYEKEVYTLGAKATLRQLTQFLFEFYSADHLQQIRRLNIHPATGGNTLDVQLTIEALALPGADRLDRLNSEPSHRLTADKLKAYEKIIVGRNLFAEYSPPAPPVVKRETPKPVDPPKPTFDSPKYAYVTAIVGVDRQAEVWLNVRTTGETLHLQEGDHFDVGGMKGEITRIGEREVEFRAGGKRMLVSVGESLRNAAILPQDGL